jgi:putative methyltransferase (TIGR04325 family)
LDFGGSLGSSYFQNKKFLDALRLVEWNVVEQENFVATGELVSKIKHCNSFIL